MTDETKIILLFVVSLLICTFDLGQRETQKKKEALAAQCCGSLLL